MTTRPLPFVLAASDLGPMIVSRLDYSKNAHGYYGVGFQILHTGSYDAAEVAYVLDLLGELRDRRGDGVVAIDCGANVGVHSLAMAKGMLGWGEVWAFEPQERLFYALAGNVALANLFNVHARWAAVGCTVGEVKIPRPDYTRPGSLGSLELNFGPRTEHIGQTVSYDQQNLVPVPLVSVDSLALPRVDFLKIDVEGMELNVLDGARVAINRDHPTILVEWIKSGKDAIRDFLVPFGYSLHEVGMNLVAEYGR